MVKDGWMVTIGNRQDSGEQMRPGSGKICEKNVIRVKNEGEILEEIIKKKKHLKDNKVRKEYKDTRWSWG